MTQCRFQFEPGHHLDSFTIGEPLFCGALSEVYRGTDALTHQVVAIKIPSLDIINNPLVFYHFQNEIKVLADIRHPCIVRCIQRDRSSAYSVFEYVAGRDLYTLMKREGPLDLPAARHYVRQIAQGLSYLHDCGIIHMDVKPENIRVTPLDAVKIIDFGLARRLGAPDLLQEDFTRPHGTPYYAAPEQLERYRDDPRTDLYSLALVLYEMLTGELPFERTLDLARARRRLKKDPVPPRTYRPEIPEALEAVILKALRRDPAERQASMDAFVMALDQAVEPEATLEARSRTDPAATKRACPVRWPAHRSGAPSRHILAALDNNDRADIVVETALQEALNTGAAVTLLTVVSGDGDDDWTRFGNEADGNRRGRQLDGFVRRLRRFGIEATVRIRSGSPSDRIIETARQSAADLIIMGASHRSWLKRIFGGRLLDRVLKKAPCQVRIADVPRPSQFPWEEDPDALSPGALDHIDRSLVSLWTRQLNWLADRVQRILSASGPSGPEDTGQAPLAAWIADLRSRPRWEEIIGRVVDAKSRFEEIEARMMRAAKEADLRAVEGIHRREAVPLLCRLREDFQDLSARLRERNAATERPKTFLDQTACPIGTAQEPVDPADDLSNGAGDTRGEPAAEGSAS